MKFITFFIISLFSSNIALAAKAIECRGKASVFGHDKNEEPGFFKFLKLKDLDYPTSAFCPEDKETVKSLLKSQMSEDITEYLKNPDPIEHNSCWILEDEFIEAFNGRASDLDFIFGYNGPRYYITEQYCVKGPLGDECRQNLENFCSFQPNWGIDFYLGYGYHINSFRPNDYSVTLGPEFKISPITLTCQEVGADDACLTAEDPKEEEPIETPSEEPASCPAPVAFALDQISDSDCVKAVKAGKATEFTYQDLKGKLQTINPGEDKNRFGKIIEFVPDKNDYRINASIKEVVINGRRYEREFKVFGEDQWVEVQQKVALQKNKAGSRSNRVVNQEAAKAFKNSFVDN